VPALPDLFPLSSAICFGESKHAKEGVGKEVVALALSEIGGNLLLHGDIHLSDLPVPAFPSSFNLTCQLKHRFFRELICPSEPDLFVE